MDHFKCQTNRTNQSEQATASQTKCSLLTVNVSDQQIVDLLDSVSSNNVVSKTVCSQLLADFDGGSYGYSQPFSSAVYTSLRQGMNSAVELDVNIGMCCTTLRWLSRRYPEALFIYIESCCQTGYQERCIYRAGHVVVRVDELAFCNFLIAKLDSNYYSLMNEFLSQHSTPVTLPANNKYTIIPAVTNTMAVAE